MLLRKVGKQLPKHIAQQPRGPTVQYKNRVAELERLCSQTQLCQLTL